MEGKVAQRAEPAVSDDGDVNIELPGEVALVKVSNRKELCAENQNSGEKRNRPGAAPNQHFDSCST